MSETGEAAVGEGGSLLACASMPSLCRATDTPTVGASSTGIGASFCLARFGGSRVKAPSTVTGRWLISVLPFFSNPAKGISVLPSDWSPQQRWIYYERENEHRVLRFLLSPKIQT